MRQRDYYDLYNKTRDNFVLQEIQRRFGKKGVSMAAKVAGVPRSELKAKLCLNNPNREIAREARKACSLKTNKSI